MNTNNTTLKTARKTALAAAIALAAAAPAFAASAPSEWAGYPSSDAVQFQAQPATLSSTAPIETVAVIEAPETDMTSTASMSTADAASTTASTPSDTGMAQASNDSSASTAMTDSTTAPSDTVVAETTTWVLLPLDTTTADATPATLPQWQQPAITRESVRAEVLAARQAGTLTPANEVGDTDRVLAARQVYNEEQSDAIVAEYQAEYDRQVAMQEAEIRRAAIEADWLQNGMAQTTTDDPNAEVQIDVISMQPLGVGE